MSVTRKVLTLLFFFAIFLTHFLPINDADFGWHYRCGKLFLETRNLCSTNEFSYILPHYIWPFPQVVYNSTLALVFDNFGFLGLSFLGATILTLFFFILFVTSKGPLAIKILALLIVSYLSFPILGLGYRSQILSLFIFTITIFLLTKGQSNKKLFYFIPFLFVVWANTHSGFFLGPLVLLLYLSGEALKRKLTWTAPPTLVLIFSPFATLINPFGVNIYLESINHFVAPLNTMIAEWTPPPWEYQLTITLSLLVAFFISKKRNSLTSLSFLLLPIFAYFAISARRNLPLYYSTLFLWTFSEFSFNFFKKYETKLNLLTGLVLVLVILFSKQQIQQTITFDTNFPAYCRESASPLPCQAIEKLKGKSGNLFASYQWGGFLIWQLPQMKVFVDGRMSAWKLPSGDYPYQVYLSIIQTQNGWNQILTDTKTNYLLINSGTFLDLLLQDKKDQFGWKELYRDDLSTLYEKLPSTNR